MMEKEHINFMPGPVNLHPDTKKIYHDTFLSHRSAKFYHDISLFRNELCSFVKVEAAAFFVGSGSLANEVVAQYLKQLGGKGLILVNGEFGKRLTEQAGYIELDFDRYAIGLGEAFDYTHLGRMLDANTYKWIWFVHCETSSGILNDLKTIKDLGDNHGLKVAVDCISTIGNIEVDLSGVYLAAGTSGKGLASYPGIAMVYFNPELTELETSCIPKYMNLKHHSDTNWVPYTISTNAFYALRHSFENISNAVHRQNIVAIGEFIYNELSALGFGFLGKRENMMPGIVSIICPPELNSYELGLELEKNLFYVNYGGAYLRNANYFQICVMGHQNMENAKKLVNFLKAKKEALALQIAS